MFMNSASGVTLFRDLGNTLLYTVVYTVYTSHSVSTGFGAWGRDESIGVSHFALHVENLGGPLLVRKFGMVFRS